MRRRRALAALAAGTALAGCLGAVTDGDRDERDGAGDGSNGRDGGGAGDRGDGPGGGPTGGRGTDDRPPLPDPDVTVAGTAGGSDGDGGDGTDGDHDFASLSAALEAVDPGSTIGLGAGSYTYRPVASRDGYERRPVLVGAGSEATRVTVAPSPEYPDRVGIADAPEFWNLRVDWPDRPPVAAARFVYARVDGPVRGDVAGLLSLFAARSSFVGPEGDLDRCVLRGAPSVGDRQFLRGCRVETTLAVGRDSDRPRRRPRVVDSLVESIDCRGHGLVLEGSTVEPPDDVAVRMADRPCRLRRNRILGRVRSAAGRWAGNVFESGRVRHFVDGDGPRELAANAFLGADVRFTGEVIIGREGLGNHYSTWNGAVDEDGDGVSEVPRRLPGGANVVDEHPLTRPDPGEYDVPTLRLAGRDGP